MTLGVFLGYAAVALFASGLASIVYILGANPQIERPQFGRRGLKRQRALNEGGLFASAEPAVRLVAGWLAGLRLPTLKEKINRKIVFGGEYLGMSADEFIASSILSMVALGVVALGSSYFLQLPSFLVGVGLGFGLMMPWMQLDSHVKARFKSINRALPTAIDLAAMCMGAGLDFPGALRQIATNASSKDADLVEELARILQELELGHTRQKALEGFASRVPTDAVLDFVNTVVQAEAKGTPLGEVLVIQARMLRMRRSVAAEEAAARAGLMMMMPLLLVFICVLLLLMGPFIVQWTTTGM